MTRGLNRLARIEPPSPSHLPTCATASAMRRSPAASPLAISIARSSGSEAGREVSGKCCLHECGESHLGLQAAVPPAAAAGRR